MPRTRTLLGGLSLAAALVGAGACSNGQLAMTRTNSAGVWVEVSPSSIEPGFIVAVRADCGDNTNPATVTSKAFGTLTLQPLNTVLQGEASVPSSVTPGTYDVKLKCHTGSAAVTTLTVLGARPTARTMGPHTGGGFLANGGTATGEAAATASEAPQQDDQGARLWLIGGLTVLVAAGAVAVVSRRRRPSSADPQRAASAELRH